ncbi:response regulator [bacterium]|nr:response regulator [bacterium]
MLANLRKWTHAVCAALAFPQALDCRESQAVFSASGESIPSELMKRMQECIQHHLQKGRILPFLQENCEERDIPCPSKGNSVILPLWHYSLFCGCLGLVFEEPEPADAFRANDAERVADHFSAVIASQENARQARAYEIRYQRLIERSKLPIFHCNAEGVLTDANPAFCELLGILDNRQLAEFNFFDLLILQPKRKNDYRNLLVKCGFFNNLEAQMKRADGQILNIHFTIVPIQNSRQQTEGYEGTLIDVTEKKELEDQLIQAQKVGVLGTLASGIAHDFNNLIGGIMGCASLVKATLPSSSPHYDDIETILNASQKASELTAQLLTFSRKEKYRVRPLAINQVVSEMLHLLSRTMEKSIRIETHLSPGLPPVKADATRIQQALMNICINARDAMPHGGRLIVTTSETLIDEDRPRTLQELPSGHYVEVRISDTGCGIPPEILDKIFQPFFTTKESSKGSGLGLAIVSEVIENFGGGIAVSSAPEKGTTFEVFFPISEEEPAGFEDAQVGVSLLGGHESILIVDDEEIYRSMGKRMLEKFGYRARIAVNGREAVEFFRRNGHEIDMLVLDVMMPEMDGIETFRSIRKLNPDIPILMTSGYDEENIWEKMDRDGPCGYIRKPFMADHFLKTIRDILGKREASRSHA